MLAVWLFSLLVFTLFAGAPGGPCAAYLGRLGAAAGAPCPRSLAPGTGLPLQYLGWLGHYLTGHFGQTNLGHPMTSTLVSGAPSSIILVLFALLCVVAASAAARIGEDRVPAALQRLEMLGRGIPAFWVGLVLLFFLSYRLGWLPSGLAQGDTLPPLGSRHWIRALPGQPALLIGDLVRHVALPVVTLALIVLAGQGHLEGIAPRREWSAVSAFRWLSEAFPQICGGVILVETVFGWHGLGGLFVTSLFGEDYAPCLTLLWLMGLIAITLRALAQLVPGGAASAPSVGFSPLRGRLIVGGLVCVCLSPLVSPERPTAWNALASGHAPSLVAPFGAGWRYVLGADAVGHSVLTWVTWGTAALVLMVGCAWVIATGLGLLFARFSWVRAAGSLPELLAAVPAVPVYALTIAFFGSGRAWVVVCIGGLLALPAAVSKVGTDSAGGSWCRIGLARRLLFVLAGLGYLGISMGPTLGTGLHGVEDYFLAGLWWWLLFPGLALAIAGLLLTAPQGSGPEGQPAARTILQATSAWHGQEDESGITRP